MLIVITCINLINSEYQNQEQHLLNKGNLSQF